MLLISFVFIFCWYSGFFHKNESDLFLKREFRGRAGTLGPDDPPPPSPENCQILGLSLMFDAKEMKSACALMDDISTFPLTGKSQNVGKNRIH